MPKIPRYTSRESIQPRSVQARAPAVRIDASSFTQTSRAMQGVGEAIFDIGQKMDNVQAQNEVSKANIKYAQGVNNILQNASNDTEDIGFMQRREKELTTLKDSIFKDIKNKKARQQFELEYQRNVIDANYKLKLMHNNLVIDNRLASLEEEKATSAENFYSATDKEKPKIIDTIAKRYNDAWQDGVMTKKDAVKEFGKWKNSLVEGQVNHDILQNPEYALGELQKGEHGAYKELAFDKRTDLIKNAESRIEKLKNQKEEAIAIATNQKESDLIDMKIAGTLTEEQVLKERETNLISAKFADTMISSLRNPKQYKPDALEGIVKYNELVERESDLVKKEWFIKKAPFEEITKFRADVIKANADGYISKDQMENLLSSTSKTIFRDKVFQTALDQLAAQSDLYATSEYRARAKSEMYGNLIKKVASGIDPKEAVTQVIQEKINDELGKAIKSEGNNNRIYATKGSKRIYSEDQGKTWFDEKTGESVK